MSWNKTWPVTKVLQMRDIGSAVIGRIGRVDQTARLLFATFVERLTGQQDKKIRIIFSNGRRL